MEKLPISIGILAWNSGQVLVDTLTTYHQNGLFDMVNDVTILFQEVTSEYQNEKIKQEFTAMLIHELRAPLTVIKSSSDLLIKRYNVLTEAKFKDILSGIKSSTEGLLDLVSDLLDTSKLEMNKLQILKRVSNLNNSIKVI